MSRYNKSTYANELEELKYRLIKLEEKVELLIDKTYINNLFKQQLTNLTREYSSLMYKLKREFTKYNPSNQLNVKKLLLNQLPDKPINIDTYMKVLYKFLKENKLEFNLSEFEILLYKLDLVEDNKIYSSRLSPEVMKII
jgi:hypothetical protein